LDPVKAKPDCEAAGMFRQQEGVLVRSGKNEGGPKRALRDSHASYLSGKLRTCVHLYWKQLLMQTVNMLVSSVVPQMMMIMLQIMIIHNAVNIFQRVHTVRLRERLWLQFTNIKLMRN